MTFCFWVCLTHVTKNIHHCQKWLPTLTTNRWNKRQWENLDFREKQPIFGVPCLFCREYKDITMVPCTCCWPRSWQPCGHNYSEGPAIKWVRWVTERFLLALGFCGGDEFWSFFFGFAMLSIFSKLMMFVMVDFNGASLAKEEKSSLFVVLKYKPPKPHIETWKIIPKWKGISSSIPSFLGFQPLVFGGVTTPQHLPRVAVRYGTDLLIVPFGKTVKVNISSSFEKVKGPPKTKHNPGYIISIRPVIV